MGTFSDLYLLYVSQLEVKEEHFLLKVDSKGLAALRSNISCTTHLLCYSTEIL